MNAGTRARSNGVEVRSAFSPRIRAWTPSITGARLSGAAAATGWNHILCALSGLTWYLQFFFYGMGTTQLGRLNQASWPLHMASIVLFATLWGRSILAIYRRPAAYFVLPFLVVFSLHAFTESVVLLPNDLVWLLFSACTVKLAAPDRPGPAIAPPP